MATMTAADRKRDEARLALDAHTVRLARRLADDLRATALPGCGFALIMFDFGDKGNLAYVSSAERQDMIKVLREMVAKLERSA